LHARASFRTVSRLLLSTESPGVDIESIATATPVRSISSIAVCGFQLSTAAGFTSAPASICLRPIARYGGGIK